MHLHVHIIWTNHGMTKLNSLIIYPFGMASFEAEILQSSHIECVTQVLALLHVSKLVY